MQILSRTILAEAFYRNWEDKVLGVFLLHYALRHHLAVDGEIDGCLGPE